MNTYIFTFGTSHPLGDVGISIRASNEEVARLAMSKMVNHWCGCYDEWANPPRVSVIIPSAVTADAFLNDPDFR